jgi:hypothetical protein
MIRKTCTCAITTYTALLSVALVTSAAEYQIVGYPALQNSLAVSGTLFAVDLNNDTFLSAAELASWSLTVDGNTVTSGDAHAGKLLTNVSIADGKIFLEDPRVSGLSEQFILAIQFETFVNYFNGPFSLEYNEQVYNGRSVSVPSPTWSAQSLVNGANLPMPASNGRIVIARLVPEPGTLAFLTVACLSLCVRGSKTTCLV